MYVYILDPVYMYSYIYITWRSRERERGKKVPHLYICHWREDINNRNKKRNAGEGKGGLEPKSGFRDGGGGVVHAGGFFFLSLSPSSQLYDRSD